MRVVVFSVALALVSGSVSAQQPATEGAAQTLKLFASSADVAALAAKAKSERKEGQALVAQSIVRLAPYNVSLEYRAAVANAAVHEKGKQSCFTSWTARRRWSPAAS